MANSAPHDPPFRAEHVGSRIFTLKTAMLSPTPDAVKQVAELGFQEVCSFVPSAGRPEALRANG